MKLFGSKKPSSSEQNQIKEHIRTIELFYKIMYDGCGIDIFVECKNRVLTASTELIKYEEKYPNFFVAPGPKENSTRILDELPECEREFIDYMLQRLERKLLDYSTDRGKRNNFNKEVDKFKYFAGEFLPETVDYFNQQLQRRFPEFL